MLIVPESIPLWLLVALIVLAVAVGLWVGGRADRELESRRDAKGGKSLTERARSAVTNGIVSMWKWNRARKKKAKQKVDNKDE